VLRAVEVRTLSHNPTTLIPANVTIVLIPFNNIMKLDLRHVAADMLIYQFEDSCKREGEGL
jgi:hypothetical protein